MKDKLLGIYGLGVIVGVVFLMSGNANHPPMGFFEALFNSIFWPISLLISMKH